MIPYLIEQNNQVVCVANTVSYTVYFLKSLSSKRTYVGYTNNIYRRIKQHNGELEGGAKRTKQGRPWQVVCIISGFPTCNAALQFEYAWHQIRAPRRRTTNGSDGKRRYIKCPHITGCKEGLELLFNKKWTGSSPEPHSFPLTCIVNTNGACTYQWLSKKVHSCWSVYEGQVDYNELMKHF